MADEGKLRKQADRGAKASALLKNELLQEAFDKIEAELLTDWKSTTGGDSQRREDAWRSFKLLQNLKGTLHRVVIDGNAASKQLLAINDKPPILKRIFRQ